MNKITKEEFLQILEDAKKPRETRLNSGTLSKLMSRAKERSKGSLPKGRGEVK